jgi:hypothetical protein
MSAHAELKRSENGRCMSDNTYLSIVRNSSFPRCCLLQRSKSTRKDYPSPADKTHSSSVSKKKRQIKRVLHPVLRTNPNASENVTR